MSNAKWSHIKQHSGLEETELEGELGHQPSCRSKLAKVFLCSHNVVKTMKNLDIIKVSLSEHVKVKGSNYRRLQPAVVL